MIIILDCTAPFEVSVVTDATQDGAAPTAANIGKFLFTILAVCLQTISMPFLGVCLEYTQEPCAAGQIGLPP